MLKTTCNLWVLFSKTKRKFVGSNDGDYTTSLKNALFFTNKEKASEERLAHNGEVAVKVKCGACID